jgi:hypothetical protein
MVQCDIGIKDGRIAGLGKAGNPDVMDGVTPGMVVSQPLGHWWQRLLGEGGMVVSQPLAEGGDARPSPAYLSLSLVLRLSAFHNGPRARDHTFRSGLWNVQRRRAETLVSMQFLLVSLQFDVAGR